jgi:phosphoribosylglycinamide formyltransferase 1
MLKIGFMASGGGSNFQAILDKVKDGSLTDVHVSFLITNNSKCGAVEKAKSSGIPVYHLSSVTHPALGELERAMVEVIRTSGIQLLVLAGYMKKIPDGVLALLPDRVINVHPALLPSFGGPGHWGHHVHEAVVAAGARVSGPTVHFVDGEYDHGKIIAQRAIPLESTDSPEMVAAKVLKQEHDLFWRVVQAFAQGQVRISEGRVHCPTL